MKTKLKANEVKFLDAAKTGSLETVEMLLKEGVCIDIRDDRSDPPGVTPLMHAAGEGHLQTVEVLLRAGAAVNARNRRVPGGGGGSTALHYASLGKHIDVILILVKAGADVSALNYGEGSPLHSAVRIAPRESGIDFTLPNVSDAIRNLANQPPSTEDDIAASKAVSALLYLGADPNIQCAQTGITPLESAVMERLPATSRTLLQHGANPNLLDRQGWGPLLFAIQDGRADLVELLLEAGADCALRDNDGNSPLIFAAMFDQIEIARMLMARGSDMKETNSDGKTAADICVERQHLKFLEMLKTTSVASPQVHRPQRR